MRLIDADALPRHGGRGGIVHWKDIEGSPTIIFEKRGRWIACEHEKWASGTYALRCSECNRGYHLNFEHTIGVWNYCPNCGARMEGAE